MKLIRPSVELLDVTKDPLKVIEHAGRTCYKSECKITDNSAEAFVQMILDRGHEAMIEHANMSMRFVCDRGVTHEIVRHRLFSYAQESTRYCNYKGGVTFIIPNWIERIPSDTYSIGWNKKLGRCESHPFMDSTPSDNKIMPEHRWFWHMAIAERDYVRLLDEGWKPQQARSVLPNSLKTEIVVTGNLREWRHFFRLRCAKAAHPQMREVADKALSIAYNAVPVIFDEFVVDDKDG